MSFTLHNANRGVLTVYVEAGEPARSFGQNVKIC